MARGGGYGWTLAAGINAALAAISAKFFAPLLLKYGMAILFNVTMWGCYVNSLKALSSLQATVTNFAANFISSGLAGYFLFQEPLPSKCFEAEERWAPGGLNKVCAISPELQTIVGETVMSRTQIVKQLWAYIRQNNLQDPDDKRKIICNDELCVVFGTDTTNMFKMNKLLARHITPLDPKDQIWEVK